MRIAEINIYQKDLDLSQPYTMAGTVLHALDSTIVGDMGTYYLINDTSK